MVSCVASLRTGALADADGRFRPADQAGNRDRGALPRPAAARRGRHGGVYEVLDLVRSERRALKRCTPIGKPIRRSSSVFFREAHVLAQLDHPNIVRMFGCGPLPNGSVYLVMELVEGESLGRFLRRHGSLPVGMVDPIVRDMALALQYAHERGIIHRDLKPSNVMLVPGRTPQAIAGAMLTDFGVALLASAARLTSTGELVGTPRYMAPEQLASWSGADARSDVDALAVLVYECLAGSSPFPVDLGPAALVHAVLHGQGVPLRTVRPDISAAIEEVIARGMALRPEDRHSSMLAFLEDWDRLGNPVVASASGHGSSVPAGTGPSAKFAEPPPPGGAWPTGRSVEAAVAAGFVALLFFAVAGFAVLWVWVSD